MVTVGSLPRYMRSLSVKDSTGRNQEPALTKTSLCSTRLVYIILTLIFIFVTSLAVGIAVVKIAEIKHESELLLHSNESIRVPNKNSTHVSEQSLRQGQGHHEVNSVADEGKAVVGTRCVRRCLVYRDPKFESSCVDGLCECRGVHYQPRTCLPNVSGCVMARNIDVLAKAFMDSERKSVYSCRSEPYTGSDIHVISIHGNNNSGVTTINISGSAKRPVTLVLANHNQLRWNIKVSGVNINKIVLLSKNSIESPEVTVERQYFENSLHSKFEIKKIHTPVGYGDDRNSSDTVGMLRVITDTFGSFRSFHGAEFADYLTIKIPD